MKKMVLRYNFPLTKSSATTQDRQTLQNSEENHYCQCWTLHLVVFN